MSSPRPRANSAESCDQLASPPQSANDSIQSSEMDSMVKSAAISALEDEIDASSLMTGSVYIIKD